MLELFDTHNGTIVLSWMDLKEKIPVEGTVVPTTPTKNCEQVGVDEAEALVHDIKGKLLDTRENRESNTRPKDLQGVPIDTMTRDWVTVFIDESALILL